MSLINYLEENLILPASDLIYRQSVASSLKFLLESQNWPSQKLKEYQEERLQTMIRHAYKQVPFYRDQFKKHHLTPSDIKSSSDLYKIPVVKKDDFRLNHPSYYCASNLPLKRQIRMNSSGSTGEPFTYYTDPQAFSFNYACAIRGWYWMGFRLGDSYAKLSQNPRKGIKKNLQDFITRSQYLFIRDLSPERLKGVIKDLNKKKPEFIRCYPDPLGFMAQIMNNDLSLNYTPRAINTTGNILTPVTRKQIENSFGAPVYDSYSCEASAQFFECPDRSAYLSSMEYAITEIINDQGEYADTGRHITTDLWNFAMPFIRYDTQDVLVRSEEFYHPVYKLESFKTIYGRNSDILITPSGKYMIVHTFTIFFEYFREIEKFQVLQSEPGRFAVRLVVNSFYSKTSAKAILNGLQSLAGDDVTIDIEIVNELPDLPSGKRKFLIRDPSIPLPF